MSSPLLLPGSVTSKYVKTSSIRRPPTYGDADTKFDVSKKLDEDNDDEIEEEFSKLDGPTKVVESMVTRSSIAGYTTNKALKGMTASEIWSAAMSRGSANIMDSYLSGGEAMLPTVADNRQQKAIEMQQEKMRDEMDERIENDHIRLLYLVSLYSHAAQSDDELEKWIRSHALFVLIFEGIVTGVFNFDYAAVSMFVGAKRVLINLSQEALDCIDDLREFHLIRLLKLPSADQRGISNAYQVSPEGYQLLKRKLTQEMQEAVDSFTHTADGDQIHTLVEGTKFILYTDSGYRAESAITNIEDVSYVSSPYVPQCLRTNARKLTSNAHRSYECAVGKTSIRDELSEAIHLADVRVMLGEYLPLGDNAIDSMCEKLACRDRIQGGLYSDYIDIDPTGQGVEVPSGLTGVRVLDFDLMNFVNFEADIHFPESEGIVQIENFGTHVNKNGFVLYALKVEAILGNSSDNISLDLLSRVMTDITMDSSRIIDSLLSEYQRTLLDLVYHNDRETREKMAVILADNIDPKISAQLYLDGGEYEGELKQVIGTTYSAYDLTDDVLMIVGKNGIMITGRGCLKYEPLVMQNFAFIAREHFFRYLVTRSFTLDNDLRKLRRAIDTFDSDPNSIGFIRQNMSRVSKQVVLLEQTLSFFAESLQQLKIIEPDEENHGSQLLFSILNAHLQLETLVKRANDLQKNVRGSVEEFRSLQSMTQVISSTQSLRMTEALQSTSGKMSDVVAQSEKGSIHLDMIKTFSGGLLAFAIFDRVTSLHLNVRGQVIAGFEPFLTYIIETPGPFLILSLIFWVCCKFGWFDLQAKRLQSRVTSGLNLVVRLSVNKHINMTRWKDFILFKKLESEYNDQTSPVNRFLTVVWFETDWIKWRGAPPKIEVTFDEKNQFLISVTFYINRIRSRLTSQSVKSLFFEDLVMAKVMKPGEIVLEENDREDEKELDEDNEFT